MRFQKCKTLPVRRKLWKLGARFSRQRQTASGAKSLWRISSKFTTWGNCTAGKSTLRRKSRSRTDVSETLRPGQRSQSAPVPENYVKSGPDASPDKLGSSPDNRDKVSGAPGPGPRGPEFTVDASPRYTQRGQSLLYNGKPSLSVLVRRPIHTRIIQSPIVQISDNSSEATTTQLFPKIDNAYMKYPSSFVDLSKSEPQTAASLRALFGW
ncbi:uncharacterized protein LOC129589606 isoform X2 [Paramacrobiotus metropolitanus]|uniref:uncharacterized protein LOC129589606 isoform X2 n=1 Tax=Paramacrobiotus metropolitanus TaxID=2943436 RepID=UPI0024458BFB|nr:uncharacterized protein LOC129589606 isoform X2 [Paramacrobiotus metropolitanus]